MPATEPHENENARRGRQLGLVAVLAVAGAALAALAATLTWWSADYVDPLTGALSIEATGAATVPELIPLALVGLAGFGAALATRGVLRRIVGAVIAVCGVVIAVRCGLAISTEPSALAEQLTRPADRVTSAAVNPLGPLLGLLGGVLLAAAGVLITLGSGARQRMGSRYERTSTRSAAGTTPDSREDDPSEWWKALDRGADPTSPDTTAQNITPPNSGAGDSAVPGTRPGDSTTRGAAEYPPTVSEHTSGDGYHDPNASRPSS